jgi:hypothetical protein
MLSVLLVDLVDVCALTAEQPAILRREDVVPRRILVREVDRPDWHLLDGDQLLPVHRGDNSDVLAARRQKTAAQLTLPPQRQQHPRSEVEKDEGDKVASFLLAEPRSPTPEGHPRLVKSMQPGSWTGDRAPQQLAIPAGSVTQPALADDVARGRPVMSFQTAPRHEAQNAEVTDKIALQSLRLVVHLADNRDDANDRYSSDDDAEWKTRAAGDHQQQRHTPSARMGRGGGTPAVLLSHPRGGLRVHRPIQRLRAHAHAAENDDNPLPPVLKTVGDAAVAADNTFVARAAFPATRHEYTDEELRRRCVMTNGRATEPAVLRAMMEGQLQQDCLVVAADVGNDIPTNDDTVKGAVAIVTLFVSTLFLVFAFAF